VASAEDGEDGLSESGGDVHRARVLADVTFGKMEEAGDGLELGGFGGDGSGVERKLAEAGLDLQRGFVFVDGADEEEL
jgi:hypothetical protein